MLPAVIKGRPNCWWVHKRPRTNVLFQCSDFEKLTGVMPTESALGHACYSTVVIQRSSRARCLLQIALIQRIHSVERWLLTDVNGHVTQQSWSVWTCGNKGKGSRGGGTQRGKIQLEQSRTSGLCLGIMRHPCDKTHNVFVGQPSAAESCKFDDKDVYW